MRWYLSSPFFEVNTCLQYFASNMMSTGMPLNLHNKRLIMGITGGIAAYKSAELVRLLQKAGASVRVVMTRAATEFITPLTLQALSGKPVHLDLLDTEAEAGMGHIELARWADAILVAPASADFLARLAQGRGDDLLTTLCLASPAPVIAAPAMNQQMWKNAATQENCALLQKRGIRLFGPATGEQACGDTGPGRMLEALELLELTDKLFETGTLSGKRVVITAGPTREALDPVRYLSNQSSGKMGYALAQAAIEAGAQVTLISGPTHLTAPARLISYVAVTSAQEMHQAAIAAAGNCDIFIGAAAVADYRPAQVAEHKMKKGSDDTLTLEFIKNTDIIADMAHRYPQIYTVGFAAETEMLAAYARTKMERKGLQMIIANNVADKTIGFNSDQNAVTVFWKNGEQPLSLASKTVVAQQLIRLIASRIALPVFSS
jgi:phosphopantothenoylcysteine decarboxylase/phosphopantothenate--cysteine ligase